MSNEDKTQIVSREALLKERFETVSVIGEGAAGTVYHVKDRFRKGEDVALKVLSDATAFDENTMARFRDELIASQRINHPNIVRAYELIDLGKQIAFTMEYIKGSDLAKLRKAGPIEFEHIDGIMVQLLEAVGTLHANGIFHRDIKLENVLLSEDGVVKLSDLGLMKREDGEGLTRAGILLGTPQYMPPEYIRGSKYDARGDIYSCGIVLYELISGERRLSDKQGMKALEHLIKTNFPIPEITRPGVPQRHVDAIKRAMQVDPERRFQTADQMKKFLQGGPLHLAGEQRYDAKPPTAFGKIDNIRFSGSSGSWAWRGLILLLAFIAAVVTILVYSKLRV